MTDSSPARADRFVALDVFRGGTVALMILVNAAGPGATPWGQLDHAPWIGFTLADAVFPSFLFAMGTAMWFALARPLPTAPYLGRLARRGAIIFLLGYLAHWFPFGEPTATGWAWRPFAASRIPGVLQRIALCYVAAGLLVRWLTARQLVAAAIGLLLASWAILVAFAPPGLAFDQAANVAGRIDLAVFGPGHLYKRDHGFDPEGLLGTLPAIVNVLAGYLVGRALQRAADRGRVARRLAAVGLGLILGAVAWAPWLPIAKKLWTGSFVLLTVGLDAVLLAAIVQAVAGWGWHRGTRFFIVFGRNPLAIYLFSELFATILGLIPTGPDRGVYGWIGITVFQTLAPGAPGSLLCAIAYTLVCWTVGWGLDRRGLILKA